MSASSAALAWSPPAEGMRLLGEDDEPAFQALLLKAYGTTYSYRALYQPGGVAALIRSNKAELWGDFLPTGEMVSHTGFLFKDPRGDYVESGMSFRNARARMRMTADRLAWQVLLGRLAARVTFVHQNTSTWHVLAQRYAERHMVARPTGFIVDYVAGERLVGIDHPDTPMQALTMTTVLRSDRLPPPDRPRTIPAGPWGAWVASVLGGLGVCAFSPAPPATTVDLALEAVEHNPSLGLARRAVVHRPGARLEEELAAPIARTDLVHVPCDGRMAAVPALERHGYVVTGVRPHATRPDEVVLQRLPGARRVQAAASLSRAALLPAGRALLESWLETCARTS